jgi:hypothetical protein
MATSEPSQDETFDEFYIAPNPPLLPFGVEEIIQLVNEDMVVGNYPVICSAATELM